jgi:hypothetical protein
MHEQNAITSKYQQLLHEVETQLEQLIIMDLDDELLFVELKTKQKLMQQMIKDLNTCPTL